MGGYQLTPEIFRHLQGVDWGTVSKELLAFAEWRARNYHWRNSRDSALAAGQSLEDVVQHDIENTISGERHWVQPRDRSTMAKGSGEKRHRYLCKRGREAS